MNVLIATHDAIFSRMLTLEFEDKNITVLSAQSGEEIISALSRAHMALIDASFLKDGALPQFPYDIIIFGYPEDFDGISTQELTKYYTLFRPFLIDDFFSSLFAANEENHVHLRVPKRKSPAESLALDPAEHIAYYKGEKINLTQKEFALLKLLFENRGEAISRERALTEIFSETDTKTNVVDVYINYLRAKIDHKFDIRMILTVRGCGYMIGK